MGPLVCYQGVGSRPYRSLLVFSFIIYSIHVFCSKPNPWLHPAWFVHWNGLSSWSFPFTLSNQRTKTDSLFLNSEERWNRWNEKNLQSVRLGPSVLKWPSLRRGTAHSCDGSRSFACHPDLSSLRSLNAFRSKTTWHQGQKMDAWWCMYSQECGKGVWIWSEGKGKGIAIKLILLYLLISKSERPT